MNSVNLYGHFGKDPELTYTGTGKAVANFRIAVNSGFGEKKTTEWVNCVAWEKQAEKVAEHGRKGKEIAIFGRMQTRKWEDRDGNTRYTTEVNCSNVVIGIKEKDSEVKPAQPEFELDQDDIAF